MRMMVVVAIRRDLAASLLLRWSVSHQAIMVQALSNLKRMSAARVIWLTIEDQSG